MKTINEDWTIEIEYLPFITGLCELILRDEINNYQGSMITRTRNIINDNLYSNLLQYAKIINDQ